MAETSTQILDFPHLVTQRIFGYLNPHELKNACLTCSTWKNVRSYLTELVWNSQMSSQVIDTLPEELPFLENLVMNDESTDCTPDLANWSKEHQSLLHVKTDNFMIVNNLLRCPRLKSLQYNQGKMSPIHDEYFHTHFQKAMFQLIPQLTMLSVEHHTPAHGCLSDRSDTIPPKSILANNLKKMTLLMTEDVKAVHYFLSCFHFPNVTTVSLGHFCESKTAENDFSWKEFISQLPTLFPSLAHLELHNVPHNVIDVFPSNLKSLVLFADENFLLQYGGRITCTQILGLQPQLRKLRANLLVADNEPDGFQHLMYPELHHLDINQSLPLTDIFPNLRFVRLAVGLKTFEPSLQHMDRYCPHIETLCLSVYGDFILQNHAPGHVMLPNLKDAEFQIFRRCNLDHFMGFLSGHQNLKKLRAHFSKLFTDTTDISRLDCPNLDEIYLNNMSFQYSPFDRFLSSLAEMQKVSKFSQMNGGRLDRDAGSPLVCQLPLHWPGLRLLDINDWVNADFLRDWLSNPQWPSKLESLSLSVEGKPEIWPLILQMAEKCRHLGILDLSVVLPPASNNGDRTPENISLVNKWDIQKNDRRAWRDMVRSASRADLGEAIMALLSVSRGLLYSDPDARHGMSLIGRLFKERLNRSIQFSIQILDPDDDTLRLV